MEQLQELRGLTCDAMFSGYGLRCGSAFFAIIHNGHLYFKVNDETRPTYEAARSGPFRYGSGRLMKDYLEVPIGVIEEVPRLVEWAELAIAAAQVAGKGRKRKIRKR